MVKKYVRVINNTVVEIIESDDINNQFHPDFVAQLVAADDAVQVGMVKTETGFDYPVVHVKTIEQERAEMRISAANARLNLAKTKLTPDGPNLLTQILDLINQMPEDSAIKILWEYETVYERLNPILVEFCTGLGLTDEQLDGLFTS